jgi:hypothetical protein
MYIIILKTPTVSPFLTLENNLKTSSLQTHTQQLREPNFKRGRGASRGGNIRGKRGSIQKN